MNEAEWLDEQRRLLYVSDLILPDTGRSGDEHGAGWCRRNNRLPGELELSHFSVTSDQPAGFLAPGSVDRMLIFGVDNVR